MSARFVEAALVAAGYDPGDREANAFYRDSILPLEYDSLLDVAGANLRLGRSVVIDAPFSPYLSDPDLHHRGRGALRLAAGRRRGGPRPRLPADAAGSAAEARPRARPGQARPLGRVLGRARRAARARGQAYGCPSSPTTRRRQRRLGRAGPPVDVEHADAARTEAPMISGTTTLVAHLGYPTHTFKSSLICNPWFEKNGIDAVVVPMGIKAEDYPDFFRSVFTLTNIRGALITMPHKVTTMELVDEVSPTAAIAGATNAVLRREDGSLLADQFDGAGFVRGVLRKGFDPSGKRALVVGNGGVGSPIAASLAGLGLAEIGLFDPNAAASEALAQRIGVHYPDVKVVVGSKDPEGYDLIVNATPHRDEGRRSPAGRRRPRRSRFVRRRRGAQHRRHPVPAGSQGQGLHDSGRQRHVVRADSRLPGVLRLRQRHARRAARNCAAVVVTEGYLTSYREIVGWGHRPFPRVVAL